MNTAHQLTFDLAHRPSLSGQDFLVAPANEDAVAWIDSWPDWPGNTLALTGPSGCGKTHLAHVFMAKSGARLFDIHDINTDNVRDLIESNPAIVIDNTDTIGSSEQEEVLFHVINMLKEMGHYAIFCARTPPAQWSVNLPDLKSRLVAMQLVSIQNPDEALLAAVMVKQFSDRQLKIDNTAVNYILPRMERSFEAVYKIVSAIDAQALQEHKNITIPLIKRVMDTINTDTQNELEL